MIHTFSIPEACRDAIVSYLRWPSGGAGQAILSFVKALRQHRHVVLFYEANTRWGLTMQPEWLVTQLKAVADVFFLRPLLEAYEGRPVPYDEFISRYQGLNCVAELFDGLATHLVHHWVSRDVGAMKSVHNCVRICVVHSCVPAPPGYDYYVFPSIFGCEAHPEVQIQKVRVIMNAIDLSFWRPSGKYKSELKKIGRVSALHSSKFPKGYIKRISEFLFQNPTVVHTIVGGGSAINKLEREICKFVKHKQVILTGELVGEELLLEIQSFDVCMYFTGDHVEIHPFSLLECLAAGISIVAEAKGGIPEIVQHGRNGFLCNTLEEGLVFMERLKSDKALLRGLQTEAWRSIQSCSLAVHERAWGEILAMGSRDRS